MSARMQKWAAIIKEAATCGMRKAEFCARKGLNPEFPDHITMHLPVARLPAMA